MTFGIAVAAVVLALAVLLAAVGFARAQRLARSLAEAEARATSLARYQGIADAEAHAARVVAAAEAEAARARNEVGAAAVERNQVLANLAEQRNKLAADYAAAKATYDRLRAEVALLEENIEDVSFGLYRPHYTFETSGQFKAALDAVYDRKKVLIRNEGAAKCSTEWTVRGSKAEGARMTKQNIKVMLRAFNGEVDAAVAKVTWNNITKMEERIRKSFEGINASGSSNQILITPEYLALSLEELRLTYEYEVKKNDEREEQRAIRERMREEEKALREIEREKKEAAEEETRFEKALAKARAEVEQAQGEELAKASARMHELEAKLAEAHDKMQRATSMAQWTKQGYVYILSNIGSFGEKVFKIGMTRRADPTDRVKELSDASVPFEFDIHGMVFSEDAPGLENAFHRQFAERRVNLVNLRKEYFHVTLDELADFAKQKNLTVELTKLAEAREYRETLAMRDKGSAPKSPPPQPGQAFPEALTATTVSAIALP